MADGISCPKSSINACALCPSAVAFGVPGTASGTAEPPAPSPKMADAAAVAAGDLNESEPKSWMVMSLVATGDTKSLGNSPTDCYQWVTLEMLCNSKDAILIACVINSYIIDQLLLVQQMVLVTNSHHSYCRYQLKSGSMKTLR